MLRLFAPSSRKLRGWARLAGVVALLSSNLAASAGRLRLIAESGPLRFEEFTVTDKQVRVTTPEGDVPLPAGARWRVDGDLRANLERLQFSPNYAIYRGLASPADGVASTEHFAIAHLRFSEDVPDRQLANALAVLLWVVDGRVMRTLVVPTAARPSRDSSHAAILALELAPEECRGAPVMLVWKDGEFLPQRRWFNSRPHDIALCEMHIGTPAEFEGALTKVKRIDARSGGEDVTLLQYAAQGGFVEAMKALRARKATLNGGNGSWGTPLHAAVENGRFAAVEWLMQQRGSWPRRNDGRTPFDCAIVLRRLDVALQLLDSTWSDDCERLLETAIRNGDTETAQTLARRPGAGLPRKTAQALMASAISHKNAVLVELLLRLGASAEADYHGVPLLVYAAAADAPECVAVLLHAGADRNRRGKDGDTALDRARAAGFQHVVAILDAPGTDAVRRASPPAASNQDAGRGRRADGHEAEPRIYASAAVDVLPRAKTVASLEAEAVRTMRNVQSQTVQPVAVWGNSGGLVVQNQVMSTLVMGEFEEQKLSSWAVVRIVVEPDGTVSEAVLVRGSPAEFGERAVETVRGFQFHPGEVDGIPVRTRMVMPVLPDGAE